MSKRLKKNSKTENVKDVILLSQKMITYEQFRKNFDPCLRSNNYYVIYESDFLTGRKKVLSEPTNFILQYAADLGYSCIVNNYFEGGKSKDSLEKELQGIKEIEKALNFIRDFHVDIYNRMYDKGFEYFEGL